MTFHAGQLVKFIGKPTRRISILVAGKFNYKYYDLSEGELFLFIRDYDELNDQFTSIRDKWGLFLVGDQFVVERCSKFKEVV